MRMALLSRCRDQGRAYDNVFRICAMGEFTTAEGQGMSEHLSSSDVSRKSGNFVR